MIYIYPFYLKESWGNEKEFIFEFAYIFTNYRIKHGKQK